MGILLTGAAQCGRPRAVRVGFGCGVVTALLGIPLLVGGVVLPALLGVGLRLPRVVFVANRENGVGQHERFLSHTLGAFRPAFRVPRAVVFGHQRWQRDRHQIVEQGHPLRVNATVPHGRKSARVVGIE
jgi:hypothetical protein